MTGSERPLGTTTSGPRERARPTGYSLVEIIVVVGIMSVLTGLAIPSLRGMRERAALQNGRHLITSALSLARASSSQWGRTSVVRIDTIRDELRVVLDTGAAGTGADTLVVREYRLGEGSGVQIESDRGSLCFNSRGVGTVAAECPTTGAVIRLRLADAVDTIVVSSAGRLRR